MLLLGIDLGTSSIKVSVLDADTHICLASAQFPDVETGIISLHPGWAEQSPELWWDHIQQAILRCHASNHYDPSQISAIGIAYQMHGLVLVDKNQQVLRQSIIWCDSRAVNIGNEAFENIGPDKCLSRLLNSPGNFTASKLAWVKANEPQLYSRIDKVLLPGDFIAMKMTGQCTTTVSALSEGIFWDFSTNSVSSDILEEFGFKEDFFPDIQPLFSSHGSITDTVADKLKLKKGIPVSYKAGDQPNNALALNVLEPGEVAATAGTSGVIYGVSDELKVDAASRINSFAHVNHTVVNNSQGVSGDTRIGVLLCINGVGIFNRWLKNLAGPTVDYTALNATAAAVSPGADGLLALPFGNGAERMLNNAIVGGHFLNLDFNIHGIGHMVRAVQEGIAFAFRYGLDIMRENGINPTVVRAGRTNLFLSDVFTQSFANINQVSVEFYEGDGSLGAAIGAGIGAGIYETAGAAAAYRKPVSVSHPYHQEQHENTYQLWKEALQEKMDRVHELSVNQFQH